MSVGSGQEPAELEPGSDVALVEAMFERLQSDLCGLADTLGQDQGERLPSRSHSATLADRGTQTEEEADAESQVCM